MKKITKTELLEEIKKFYGITSLTNNILQNYLAKGLIKRLDHTFVKGIRGSVAYFPENTPGLIYLIETLKNEGYELIEIKKYLDLIKLNSVEVLNKIKWLIDQDRIYKEKIIYKEGISPKTKAFLLKEIILNPKITGYGKLEKVISLKAYSEIDRLEIARLILENSQNLKAVDDLQEKLENPEIKTNIDKLDLNEKNAIDRAYISVKYDDPFNIDVLFKRNEIRIIK